MTALWLNRNVQLRGAVSNQESGQTAGELMCLHPEVEMRGLRGIPGSS
jgi:hypothetical protein